jgi:hypothetical protein
MKTALLMLVAFITAANLLDAQPAIRALPDTIL